VRDFRSAILVGAPSAGVSRDSLYGCLLRSLTPQIGKQPNFTAVRATGDVTV